MFRDLTVFASVVVDGGSGDYQYLWSNGQTEASINNLSVGLYTVEISDANQCLATLEVNIIALDLEAPIALAQDVLLFLDENGTAHLQIEQVDNGSNDNCDIASMSLRNQQFDYVLPSVTDNCPIGNINFVSGIGSSGIFPLGTTVEMYSYTDAGGNTSNCSFTVTLSNTLEVQIEDRADVCFGASDGMAVVTASGGTAPYDYQSSNGQSGAMAIDLAAGDYQVEATDATGCVQNLSVTILENPEML